MSSNQPRQTKAQRREAARLKAKELREASARRERRNMIARRSFIGVAGLGVTGGLGYLVYRGVEAKNGTKDNKSSSKFPAPSEGLATAKANQSGIPKQVLSDASWTYGEGPALDTVAAATPGGVSGGVTGGIIGGMSVAKSAADGYTFLMTTSGLIVAHPSLYADNRLDMRTELTPISIVAAFPNVLIVHPSTGLDNVRDLIARARAEPGRIKYASGGNGTSNHLAAELLKYETGIDLLHVPYRGGGPAVQAVVSGVADMVFVAPSPAIPLINAGLVKALAVTSREPSRLVPGMPTMIEAGVPNFQLTNWIGVLAPKAIPPEIANRVSKAIAETVRSPDVAELLIKNGYEGVGDTAVEMAKVIDTETAMWARVIKAAGISVN